MPFLHGFRRIIFEYQPLVDEILGAMGFQYPEQPSCSDPGLLKKLSQSQFYKEGVSYCLLKVTELGSMTAAVMLLQNGADLNFEDPITYYTALHVAVLRNRPDMVEFLVDNGADVNKRDRIHESSPLDLASEEPERLPCLQRLLQLGADINAADKNGKTALLHALASSDGVEIHNTENIRLLLEGGADVKATTKDFDTVFSCIIFLLGETVGSDKEEAKLINRFCFRASKLLIAHGADPSDCPSHESLTHTCLKNFKLHFPLLRFLLESGASYNCSQHGPSCWSGFHIVLDRLCSYLSSCEDGDSADILQKAECVLDLMVAHSPCVKLPRNFEISTASLSDAHASEVTALHQSFKQMERSVPALKHLCRVHILQSLRPWPVDVKVKTLPLPDRLKWYLLINHSASSSIEEDL
uniref:Ankyrin repeat and SOCS box containing 6 n=1 Tax=Leptobrachium leishanense TaxID=445787 RepID=A0A8C5R6Z9_9ANUR